MFLSLKIVKEAKEVLRKFAMQVPSTLFSVERQIFIGKEIIRKIPEQEKGLLRKFMNGILLQMRDAGASDIDFGGWGAKHEVWLRVNGIKRPAPEFGSHEIDEANILIQNLLMESQRQTLYDYRNLDFSYNINHNETIARYRANVYFDIDSLSLNMRAINTEIRNYESYGFNSNVTSLLSLVHTKEGLILVTGITGSGKSTTLDAIVDLNNRCVNAHIIIIASPVEFVHESKKCIIRHREVGRDTRSFKMGTIEALRQDPDIIVIGEMREADTIMAALEVADSGHKVLSTLHTSSAVESIDRIIGEVPPIEQERVINRLADILKCVVSQKLVPSEDGKRILAKEIMVMTPSIRAAIKNKNTSEIYQMINEGRKYGMITIEQDLARLAMEKKVSVTNAVNFANNKRRVKQLLKLA